MKKTILVAMMAFTLAGCTEPLTSLSNRSNLTAAEQGYIVATEIAARANGSVIVNQNQSQVDRYREVWWDFAKGADSRRSQMGRDDMAKLRPFCDMIEEVRVVDYRLTTQFPKSPTLQMTFREITGKSIEENCGLVPAVIPVARTVQTERTGDGEPELAPETYGLMIDAAKSCERARISLMSYPSGYVFTKKDYNKIMNLVNDCKRFELESSINSK